MARQDVVHALVSRHSLEQLRDDLETEFEIEAEQIEVQDAEPGTYRDEQADRELRSLVRTGRARVAVGAVLGGVAGLLVALAIPMLRDLLPISALLLAFGGAWGAGVAVAARSVQVHRDEGPRTEKLHEVTARDAEHLAMLTIHALADRVPVVDHLADRGVVLLDSQHPRVGTDEPGARPADADDDRAGPTEH